MKTTHDGELVSLIRNCIIVVQSEKAANKVMERITKENRIQIRLNSVF